MSLAESSIQPAEVYSTTMTAETSGDLIAVAFIGVALIFLVVFMVMWKVRQFINDLRWALMTSIVVSSILLTILYNYTGSLFLSAVIICIPLGYFLMRRN